MFGKPPSPLPSLPPLAVPHELATDLAAGSRREWLETNGLGSFAMGTVAGPSTRRYHAILCAATRPPVGRMVFVNRLEETAVVDGSPYDLSTSFYPGAVHPEGYRAILGFRLDPWPTWTLRAGSAIIERSLFMPHGRQMTVVTWRLVESAGGSGRARLFVRPLISGRDYHALHHENDVLDARRRHRRGAGDDAPLRRACPRSTCTTTACSARGPIGIAASNILSSASAGSTIRRTCSRPASCSSTWCPTSTRWPSSRSSRRASSLRASELRHEERVRRGALLGGCESDVERTAAPRRRKVRGAPRRAPHHRRRLSVVHRLGTRHLHLAARPGAGHGLAGAGARAAAGVGAAGARWAHSQPLPRRRRARVHRGRRAAVVRAGGAPLRRSASTTPTRARGSCPRSAPSSTASSTAPASASASTTTAWCTPPRRRWR